MEFWDAYFDGAFAGHDAEVEALRLEGAMMTNDEWSVFREELKDLLNADGVGEVGGVELLGGFELLLAGLREAKPDERSEKARRYAVTITELEKVTAYFKTWVVDDA